MTDTDSRPSEPGVGRLHGIVTEITSLTPTSPLSPPPSAVYLVFDTETSGLPDFKAPAEAEHQPRLASIHMIMCDAAFEIVWEAGFFIKREGWSMSPGATEKNGISDALLDAKGIPVVDVLNLYSSCVLFGLAVVAHHAQHDCKIMRGELRRAGMDDLFEKTRNICTMRAMAEQCRIPAKNGRGWKWPKLAEALAHATGRDLTGAHQSVNDAKACYDIAKFLHGIGALPEATVHYAKGRE